MTGPTHLRSTSEPDTGPNIPTQLENIMALAPTVTLKHLNPVDLTATEPPAEES